MRSLLAKLQSGSSFWRYLIVGVGTSLLDLTLFSLLSVVIGINEVVSNVCSTIVTVCVSYLVNRSFVFRAERATWKSFFSFAGVTLVTGMLIQSAVIWGVIRVGHALVPSLPPAFLNPASKVFAMGIGAICNYLGYRYVFGR